ncbi:hypothetical protein BSIN_3354 [Burkholderia singularis]|uniref:Uncharacterized protein n=1 Tax=Burkholderia singularis TaxID=1503053 RepID=A0A238H528_9BURK|nr:hypothetical protein BSIN_3354 [Burkholderia singularis]
MRRRGHCREHHVIANADGSFACLAQAARRAHSSNRGALRPAPLT